MTDRPLKLAGIKGKLPVVHQFIYELRFRHGYTYLDRCGRILTTIERDNPEWIIDAGSVNPQGAAAVNIHTGLEFRFSSMHLSLSWDRSQDDDELTAGWWQAFLSQAEGFTSLVTSELGIRSEQLARIGLRVWYFFAAESREEAETWLNSLGCCQVSPRLQQGFAGATITSTTSAVVLTGSDRCFRISFATGERQAQIEAGSRTISFRPQRLPRGQRDALVERERQELQRKRLRQTAPFATVIDIDSYQEDPLLLDVSHFLQSSWDTAYDNLRNSIQ